MIVKLSLVHQPKNRNVPVGGSLNGSDMSESRKGPSFVHCSICSTDFSVASGGLYDVKRHIIDGKKHSEAARGMTSQSTLAETLEVCRRKDVLVLEEQVTTA